MLRFAFQLFNDEIVDVGAHSVSSLPMGMERKDRLE